VLYEGQFLVLYCAGDQLLTNHATPLDINSESLRLFVRQSPCYRYSSKLKAENEVIADLLTGLTDARKTWGFGLCFLHLRNVKGHPWNHIA